MLNRRRATIRREPIRPASAPVLGASDEANGNGDSRNSHEESTIPSVPSTPSKKRKLADLKFGDAASGFSPPTTPRHRKINGNGVPLTTPKTPYGRAKALFYRGAANDFEVLGREEERKVITTFIEGHLNGDKGGALYISGVPGTGKSATIADLLKKKFASLTTAIVNCMIVDSPERIFKEIFHALQLDATDDTNKTRSSETCANLLEQHFKSNSSILVLDELDHLISTDSDVLFTVIRWAFMPSSKLVLIGIANALNLVDRIMPRLKAHQYHLEKLAFKPYGADDIAKVISARLRTLLSAEDREADPDFTPLMHPAAIQLCARKTAANTGDLRKAFDICRRAIELIEEDERRAKDLGGTGASSKQSMINGDRALFHLQVKDATRASVAHVARVWAAAFGGAVSSSRVKGLNVQQKAVLCVLISAEKNGAVVNSAGTVVSSSNLTVLKLYEIYSTACKTEQVLDKLSLQDFLEVMTTLECCGVVSVTGIVGRKGMGVSPSHRNSQGGGGASCGKDTIGVRDEYGLRRVVSNVHAMDVVSGVGDIPLLRKFLV